jgi:hypothetical protein
MHSFPQVFGKKNTIEQTIATQKQKVSIATISFPLAKSPENFFSLFTSMLTQQIKKKFCVQELVLS